jgi:hypothetical protein
MTDQPTKPILNTTRRQFAALGVAAVAATGMGSAASAAALPVVESALAGSTLFAPEMGEYPGLVMYASPAASQSANAAVARDLAKQGWAVMLVATPSGDAQAINRAAKGHATALAAQPGVTGEAADYSLRGVSAAQPALSLASRSERQAAVQFGVLFALPAAAAKSATNRDSLDRAARTLYRLAA